ncbi:hypothetical protein D9758_009422 [Tetrapyrgos nigripes]|uniref:Uncharacterized protein n=1 Tax=Tetrapyrgos nigripes TaxID=182062 RepID=A0A8H5FX54_9AGAR|nr:hypothetical protein D9758_009422 [Tetrapyrgos nigripes]
MSTAGSGSSISSTVAGSGHSSTTSGPGPDLVDRYSYSSKRDFTLFVPIKEEEEEDYNIGADPVSSPESSLAPSDSISQADLLRSERGSSTGSSEAGSKLALSLFVRHKLSFQNYLERVPCTVHGPDPANQALKGINFTRGLDVVKVYLDKQVKPQMLKVFQALPKNVQQDIRCKYPDLYRTYPAARKVLALDSVSNVKDVSDGITTPMIAEVLKRYDKIGRSDWDKLTEEEASISFMEMSDEVFYREDGSVVCKTQLKVKTVVPATPKDRLDPDSRDPTAMMKPDHLQVFLLTINCDGLNDKQYEAAKRLVDLLDFRATKTEETGPRAPLTVRLIPFAQEFTQRNGELSDTAYQLTEDLMVAASINTLLDLPFPSYGAVVAPQGCGFYAATAQILEDQEGKYLSFDVTLLQDIAKLPRVYNSEQRQDSATDKYDSHLANLENWFYYSMFMYNQMAWFDKVISTVKERSDADPLWVIRTLEARSHGLKPWLRGSLTPPAPVSKSDLRELPQISLPVQLLPVQPGMEDEDKDVEHEDAERGTDNGALVYKSAVDHDMEDDMDEGVDLGILGVGAMLFSWIRRFMFWQLFSCPKSRIIIHGIRLLVRLFEPFTIPGQSPTQDTATFPRTAKRNF